MLVLVFELRVTPAAVFPFGVKEGLGGYPPN